MGWREAARLADVAFQEVSLQAAYAFRQGNPVPASSAEGFVRRAQHRVAQSKALIGGLLAVLALGSAALLRASTQGHELIVPYPLPPGLYQAGVLTGLVGLEVALLWWTGIQALPTYLGPSILGVIEVLPVDPATLRKVAVLLYLRLFDLPAIVVLFATPLFVGVALGPVAGLATVPASTSAVVFALALSLVTGRFFVRRVQGARGGGGSTVVRWAYLVLWLLPAFGFLAFVSASPPFFGAVGQLSTLNFHAGVQPLVAVYPFPLALLPPLLSGGPATLATPSSVMAIGLFAGAFYSGLAGFAAAWLYASLARAAIVPPAAIGPAPRSTFLVRPQRPALAVLTKDLRLASRTPGYAFLVLLPILDAVSLGLVSYVGHATPSAARGIALGAVSSAALLATFFGPAFFALEVVAQSYGRTLPLTGRSMALGKVALIGAIYLAAGGIVLAIASLRIPAPALFAAFVAAELPAVLAAGLLELAILFRWARARGLPVTNLYSGSWNILVVAVPGVVVAGLPLAVFLLAGLGAAAAVSVAELAAVALLALRRGAS